MCQSEWIIPTYVCHKEVQAFMISEIEITENGANLHNQERNAYTMVPHDYINKHSPYVGGYFVKYKDGYKSFSPPEAFESGYSRK